MTGLENHKITKRSRTSHLSSGPYTLSGENAFVEHHVESEDVRRIGKNAVHSLHISKDIAAPAGDMGIAASDAWKYFEYAKRSLRVSNGVPGPGRRFIDNTIENVVQHLNDLALSARQCLDMNVEGFRSVCPVIASHDDPAMGTARLFWLGP